MNPMSVTKKERLLGCLEGRIIDRPPVSFWRHFPILDRNPGQLSQAVLDFQRRYDLDFIKFTPEGLYMVAGWGLGINFTDNPLEEATVSRHIIHEPQDWGKLAVLDPGSGALGMQLECLDMIRQGLEEDVPVLMTIFSPLTCALKLAGPKLYEYLRKHPDYLKAGLEIITNTITEFVRRCLDYGIWGIFFATQCATYLSLIEEEYSQFGKHYDLQVLGLVDEKLPFNILHIDGRETMFDIMVDYTVHAIHWHTHLTRPTLAEAFAKYGGGLAGGLDEHSLVRSTKEQIEQ